MGQPPPPRPPWPNQNRRGRCRPRRRHPSRRPPAAPPSAPAQRTRPAAPLPRGGGRPTGAHGRVAAASGADDGARPPRRHGRRRPGWPRPGRRDAGSNGQRRCGHGAGRGGGGADRGGPRRRRPDAATDAPAGPPRPTPVTDGRRRQRRHAADALEPAARDVGASIHRVVARRGGVAVTRMARTRSLRGRAEEGGGRRAGAALGWPTGRLIHCCN